VNIYPFIEAEKSQRRNVKRACELLKVSRAAYYAARRGQLPDRDRQDAELATRIKAEHKRSRGRYGAPRIHAELGRQGHRHGRKRIARLMRRLGWPAGPRNAGRRPRSQTRPRTPGWTGSAGTSPLMPATSTHAGAGTSPTSAPGKGGCSWPP
jgi:transposase InsO family protein